MHRFNEPTRTYGVGRFVVDIPSAMTFAGGYYFQGRAIDEIVWQDEKDAANTWKNHLKNIGRREAPQGVSNVLIEQRDIEGIGTWCKTALYFNEPLDPLHGAMDLLLNTGPTGFWVKALDKKLSAKATVYEISSDIARAYRAPQQRFGRVEVIDGRDAFYLRYGAVDLPFEYKESVDIVFRKHPLDKQLLLTIDTRVVERVNPVGMLEGLAAALAANIAPGVEVERIRTRKRTVAGLTGEEMILQGTEHGQTMLNFQWYYPGRANDSLHPRMRLIMDADDGAVEAKTALWDAILDSMRPAGR